ncbi:hypothetical protein E6C27_scaffold25G00860 [Cucumis melo var. makuwa]|uniref:Uncharacterized protein n=1 Tax=Cucumis melo var. makuwa TaxID=1194695 RepID=A0A5A7VMS0_CUCMM|nr:hypothetical protein E6C27_scaffold25G00860 [Cucumis melo var. makuwa]
MKLPQTKAVYQAPGSRSLPGKWVKHFGKDVGDLRGVYGRRSIPNDDNNRRDQPLSVGGDNFARRVELRGIKADERAKNRDFFSEPLQRPRLEKLSRRELQRLEASGLAAQSKKGLLGDIANKAKCIP